MTAREVHEKIGRIATSLPAEVMKAEDRDRTTIWELVDARMGLERTKNDRGYRKGTVAHGIDHCFRLLKNCGLVTQVRIVDEEVAHRLDAALLLAGQQPAQPQPVHGDFGGTPSAQLAAAAQAKD